MTIPKITSECPGFRKGWDESVKECRDCLIHFPEEYFSCKKSVANRLKRISDVPFRKETVAYELYTLLKNGFCLTEAEYVDKLKAIFQDQTLPQIKRQVAVYFSIWKTGTWNDKPLPFKIMKNKDGTYKITEIY